MQEYKLFLKLLSCPRRSVDEIVSNELLLR
jgi:hypothetical protein